MYASRTVCSRCAPRLRPAQAQAQAQRLGIALFSSQANASDAQEHQQAQPQPQSRPPPAQARHDGPGSRRRPFKAHQHASSKARVSEDSALALFNDVVKKPRSSGEDQANAVSSFPSSYMAEWDIAAMIKDMMQQSVLSSAVVQQFVADVWPHVEKLRPSIPRHLYISVTQFLRKACDDTAENGTIGQSLQISNMCSSIGVWDLQSRNQLVLNHCHLLIDQGSSSTDREAIIQELLDLWKHISQLRRKSRQWDPLQFAFPSPEEIVRDIEKADLGGPRPNLPGNMDPATRALTSIFLQYQPEKARALVPGLIATLAVLSDPKAVPQRYQMEAAPLFNVAAIALERAGISNSWLGGLFDSGVRFPDSKLAQLKSYLLEQWPQAATLITDQDATWRGGLTKAKTASRTSPKNSSLADLHKQLRAAYRARNTDKISALWRDLKMALGNNPSIRQQLAHDAEFLNFWVFVLCATRRPAMLQEAFTLMNELGVQPTVKTYTAMMHGWKLCKDVSRIEALWNNLVDSGMPLDHAIWTERISALIELGKPEAGLQALAEMQAAWKKAPKAKDGTDAVPPTVKAVNAAFKGLVRLDPKAAHEVLAWAAREGIEPDVRTYNILLQERFRSGAPGGASTILKAMKERGIEPDGATFTIILEEVLGSMAEASAAEQVQAVQQILADIEDAGLRPNLETYGKMLYAVVSLPNGGASDAIAAIQEHMRAHGMTALSPHMITILIERVAQRNPPDVEAIRAILRQHGLSSIAAGDQTLWERVTSAYAAGGDTDAALRVFNDLADAGRPVSSLSCLKDLMQALLAENKLDDAKKVVSVVLRNKSLGQTNVADRYWRHRFWYLVHEHGLLNWDEAPKELSKVFAEQK